MVSNLVLIYFCRPRLGHTAKTNLITFHTVDPEIYSILIFYRRGQGLVSSAHFVYDFSRKLFLMLYPIN